MSFLKVSLTAGLVIFTTTLGNIAYADQQLPPELEAQVRQLPPEVQAQARAQIAAQLGLGGADDSLSVQDVDLKETTCRKLNFTFKDGAARNANLAADDTLEFGDRKADEAEVQNEATGQPASQIKSISIEASFSKVPQEALSTSAVKAKLKLDGSQLGETNEDRSKTVVSGVFEFEKNAEIDVVDGGPEKAGAAEEIASKFAEEFAGIKAQFPNLSMNLEFTDKNKEEVKKGIIDSPDGAAAEFGYFTKPAEFAAWASQIVTSQAAPNESVLSKEDQKSIIADATALKEATKKFAELKKAFSAALNPPKDTKLSPEALGKAVGEAYIAMRTAGEPLSAQQTALQEKFQKLQAGIAAPLIKSLNDDISAAFKGGANSYVSLNKYPQRRDVDGVKKVVEVTKIFICQSNAKFTYPDAKAAAPKKAGGAKPAGAAVGAQSKPKGNLMFNLPGPKAN